MSQPPLVSIVTPAYNEEKYLSECIESVLAQTYDNWDYTIVDNHSTDDTRGVADRYAARDHRIHVITNDQCEPAIRNFNIALRRISDSSKYCKMVLADDWLFPECLTRMVAIMERYPTVGVVGAYGLTDCCVLWTGLPYPSSFVSGREIARQRLLGAPYVFGSQTSVLFRSDLVRGRDPFFNESNDHPDSEACLAVLKESDFGFVHQVLTFSRKRSTGSILNRSQSLNTLAASRLYETVAYGRFYLTPEEYESSFDAMIRGYYEFLARSLLEGRNRDFWDYHKARLSAEGVRVTPGRLAVAFGRFIGNGLLARLRPPKRGQHWGIGDGSIAPFCR